MAFCFKLIRVDSLRPFNMTLAPLFASAIPMAKPRPLLEPEINAHLPWRLKLFKKGGTISAIDTYSLL